MEGESQGHLSTPLFYKRVARAACVLLACLVVGISTAFALPKVVKLFIQAYDTFIELTSGPGNGGASYFICDNLSIKTEYIPRGYHYNNENSVIVDNSASLEFIKDEEHLFVIKYYNDTTALLIDPENQSTDKRLINGSFAILETNGTSLQITWAVENHSIITIEGKNMPENTLIKIAEGIRVEQTPEISDKAEK